MVAKRVLCLRKEENTVYGKLEKEALSSNQQVLWVEMGVGEVEEYGQ